MASSSLSSPAKAIPLPLRDYPSINPFALDLVTGAGRASSFLPRGELAAIRPTGRPKGRDTLCAALAASNDRWGNDVRAEVERWNRGESVALIAGQQATFGGGAIYTLAKIASLISLRDSFAANGIQATIFFWMATEDSDFSEAATLWFQKPDGEMTPLRAEPRGASRKVIGPMTVPVALREAVGRAAGITAAPWLSDGITFGESFALLLAEAFRERGIVLVDSLLPELRQAGVPLFQALLDELPGAEAAVARRSAELETAGYRPQISAAPDGHYSLLFLIDDGGDRDALRKESGGWRVGGRKVDGDFVAGMPPERYSTAALARPLLQDFVFQPEVFLGGPSEVAYYAQLAPLHEMLGVSLPHVGLRGHALVAPRRTLSTMERFAIQPAELFAGPEQIIARRDPHAADSMERVISEASTALEEQFGRVRDLAVSADRGLDRSMSRSMRRIQYHFQKLSERGRRAALRFDRERYDAVRGACDLLAPQGQPQDRIAAWLGWWLTYGASLIDRTAAGIQPDSDVVNIIPM